MNRERFSKWFQDERGSYTIESVIVFPLLLGAVLLFILFGMYLYQNVVLNFSTAVTAERAAFSWDNSHRDSRSGLLLKPEYDGLYRRLGSDEMLSSLFGMAGSSEDTSLELPKDINSGGNKGSVNLSNQKLIQAAAWIAEPYQSYRGKVFYNRKGLKRYVEVRLQKPIDLFPWERSRFKADPEALSKGHIVEPVEFIRSVDLVRYYTTKFTNNSMGKTTAKERAAQVLSSYEQTK
ncbi:TadE/TadG family type IV pilus assembly protein [Paenibacillus sp. L3-i20]|uniref:TadE/TadG family type IV pilus assembly protein n=1 Tax=Paenibacillus sp. L3-i20 TaxID=2905833 RepID=UPI001EDEDC4C|nr:TadE family protein [Paenibacillus sp. L3-i20]GKU76007.1 hypothetical protein L3i20_v204040 [Paenibacillus sp. L3-i20]